MSNFNEDRRQGCVDFIYIKYKDFWDGGGGGGGVGGVVIIIVTAPIIDMQCRSSVSGIELEDLLLMS